MNTTRCLNNCIGCLRATGCEKCFLGRCDDTYHLCVNSPLKPKPAKKQSVCSTDKGDEQKSQFISPYVSGTRQSSQMLENFFNISNQAEQPLPPTGINTGDTQQTIKRKYAKKQKLDSNVQIDEMKPRQCWGPECENAARMNSRYCKDECGEREARLMLTTILPDKIENWRRIKNQTQVAQQQKLEEMEMKKKKCVSELKDLKNQETRLESWYDACKLHLASISLASEDDEDSNDGNDALTVNCQLCGKFCPSNNFVSHAVACSRKREANILFEGPQIPNRELQAMFCNHPTNKKDNLYCQRLKIICPDHSKPPPKEKENVACGAPINVDHRDSSYFPKQLNPSDQSHIDKYACRRPRNKCDAHHYWYRMMKANIQQAYVLAFFRADEIITAIRHMQSAINNRPNLLGLLLNETYSIDRPK